MRTGGSGSEGLLIVFSVLLVTAVGILITGSPHDFFHTIDRTLQQYAGGAIEWIRSRF